MGCGPVRTGAHRIQSAREVVVVGQAVHLGEVLDCLGIEHVRRHDSATSA